MTTEQHEQAHSRSELNEPPTKARRPDPADADSDPEVEPDNGEGMEEPGYGYGV